MHLLSTFLLQTYTMIKIRTLFMSGLTDSYIDLNVTRNNEKYQLDILCHIFKRAHKIDTETP